MRNGNHPMNEERYLLQARCSNCGKLSKPKGFQSSFDVRNNFPLNGWVPPGWAAEGSSQFSEGRLLCRDCQGEETCAECGSTRLYVKEKETEATQRAFDRLQAERDTFLARANDAEVALGKTEEELKRALERAEDAEQQRNEGLAELIEIDKMLKQAHPLCDGNVAVETAEQAARLLTEFTRKAGKLTFSDYQQGAQETADGEQRLARAFAGIAGESGELNEKWKKHLRGDFGHSTQGDLRNNVVKELGDLLWYCAELATVLGLELDQVAKNNLHKLADRAKRGVIQGDGDER